MTRCRNAFRPGVAAVVLTGERPDARFGAGRRCRDGAAIPCVTDRRCFLCGVMVAAFFACVCRITFFRAGRLCHNGFIGMTRCRNRLCLRRIAAGAIAGLLAVGRTGRRRRFLPFSEIVIERFDRLFDRIRAGAADFIPHAGSRTGRRLHGVPTAERTRRACAFGLNAVDHRAVNVAADAFGLMRAVAAADSSRTCETVAERIERFSVAVAAGAGKCLHAGFCAGWVLRHFGCVRMLMLHEFGCILRIAVHAYAELDVL